MSGPLDRAQPDTCFDRMPQSQIDAEADALREQAEIEADEQTLPFAEWLQDIGGESECMTVVRAALAVYACGGIHGDGKYAYADLARGELSRACDALRQRWVEYRVEA